MKLADRRGNIEECSSGQDRLLEWIYTHETGRFLMKGLINPHISEIGAAFLDSRASRVLIAWFIRKNKIPMYQYEQKKYRSFNEFFKRKALSISQTMEQFLSAVQKKKRWKKQRS
ncbi:MAG: hypothetical protein ACLR6X_09785 [Mediterraneibacter gnavus]